MSVRGLLECMRGTLPLHMLISTMTLLHWFVVYVLEDVCGAWVWVSPSLTCDIVRLSRERYNRSRHRMR
ncbi:hypothetical protein AAC387_Pa09g0646 [Persea americana]